MIALTRAQRGALLFVSASAYLAWYSGLGERLEAQGIAGTPAPSLTIVARAAPPHLSSVIVRDPFAGTPAGGPIGGIAPGAANAPNASQNSALSANPNGTAPNIPTSSAGDTAVVAVVPDIGGRDGGRDGAALTLVVRATIVGRNPVAYVANGSMMDIVRVGDRLGDRRIARIDLRGIAFSDGSRIDLPGAFVPTPPPVKSATAITIKLDDLRKLISRPTSQTPPLAPGVGANPTTPIVAATPMPTGTFPSPGPLPMVDQRGIPVGTNPTPNASGPTPYPNPYPYAPPALPKR